MAAKHFPPMKLNQVAAWAGCLLALLVAGCATDGGDRGGDSKPKPCILDELRAGDMVTITYSDVPPPGIPEQKVRIKDDGTISLPQNLSVLAAGKKVGVVEKEIVQLLRKYYNQISVSIQPSERWYSVGGEVKSPGRIAYWGDTTVVRAIQSCGDFTDYAQRTKVLIHRANGQLEIVNCKKAIGNPKFDVQICPGDAILVPRRGI